MDYSIIERAGLAQGEVAELIGVSRVSLNHYINKAGHKPQPAIIKRMEGVFSILERLVALEKLPKAIKPKDRAGRALLMAQLHKVIQKHLDPAPANE